MLEVETNLLPDKAKAGSLTSVSGKNKCRILRGKSKTADFHCHFDLADIITLEQKGKKAHFVIRK